MCIYIYVRTYISMYLQLLVHVHMRKAYHRLQTTCYILLYIDKCMCAYAYSSFCTSIYLFVFDMYISTYCAYVHRPVWI